MSTSGKDGKPGKALGAYPTVPIPDTDQTRHITGQQIDLGRV